MNEDEQRLVLLVDYKREFFPRRKRSSTTTHLERLQLELKQLGFKLDILGFDALDLRAQRFFGVPVFYQSSQDPDLHYKGYIEDVLFALHLAGARLIPGLPFFRAHHNKVMMELLRDLSPIAEMQALRSRTFGTYEDFEKHLKELTFPVVLKRSDGDSGSGVVLARDAREAVVCARRLMRSLNVHDLWDNTRRWARRLPIKPHSLHRRKLIAQPFVAGLEHDYKAVWMGKRVFVETRQNRPNDFRASGSGMRDFPRDVPATLLDVVEQIGIASGSAYASIDLMVEGDRVYVGEFQFLRFGTNPVILAPHAWERQGGSWVRCAGPFGWETELACAMASAIRSPRSSTWTHVASDAAMDVIG